MMGCIYMATNLITGKSYIGQTDDFKRRKSEHLTGKKNYDFNKAIRKYGRKVFAWKILIDGIDNPGDLDSAETLLIKKHNTLAPNGYNLLAGDHSQKHRGEYYQRQLAGIRKATKSKEWQVQHAEQLRQMHSSPEWRKKHAAAMARNPKNPEWRRKHAAMVERMKKPVECIETGIVFRSTKDAERVTGIDCSSISKVCRGKRKIAGGFHWIFSRNKV